jgi:proteasome assembly chaperone (PAC2) family protein
LEQKAQQIDAITSKLKEIEAPAVPKREDLGYIG